MPVTHTNRKGHTYYLHSGPKRGGGTQFYFSRKKDGTLPDGIPDGYGIHEHPDGMVYLRCKADQRVTEDEIQLVRAALPNTIEKFSYLVNFKKETITIHQAELPPYEPNSFFFSPSPERIREIAMASAHYMPMMRFVLQDRKMNLFQTGRYCFRGSIDGWITVGAPGPLASLVQNYVGHLGQDSFYELF